MKSKKSRHETSSDDSEDSDMNRKSQTSSDSDSENSSESERRPKKKRKHADSSDSESDSEDQKRARKRKHKKKKKKHGKKKRRANSGEESLSEVSSGSEGLVSSKKRRKHKHKHKSSKRARSSSGSVKDYSGGEHDDQRLHSVVQERRASSEDGSQPSRTYYQKEYHQSGSGDDYAREREVQRFYRGSSKERRRAQEEYEYERSHYERYQQEKYKYKERYGQNSHYTGPGDDYNKRQKEYDAYKRPQKYEQHQHQPPNEEYQRRPREEVPHGRGGHQGYPGGYNRYNQHEDRELRRREYEENRHNRERRGPPESERSYPNRDYSDKRERVKEEGYISDRLRDGRRDGRPSRPEKPPIQQRVNSPSPEDRRRERERPRSERPRERRPDSPKPRERKSRFGAKEDDKDYQWGKTEVKKEGTTADEKEKPNFGLSGKLTADANTVNGVVIKYTEPEDAKQPKRRWRFYPFKGDKALPILYIHRQSSFLMGRDKKVVDIHLEHPSVSKQHAALQFRATPFTRPDGSSGRRVRPYIIDLESANGTFVNNKKIEPRRYVELLERDVVKFGFSQREYVLLHENSKDDAQDDDNQDQPAIITSDKIKQEKRAQEAARADGD